jgi:hypothetical protein
MSFEGMVPKGADWRLFNMSAEEKQILDGAQEGMPQDAVT